MFTDRIYVLDGAMGTMIQRSGCTCAGCGGDFNSELLNLEDPGLISSIHRAYIDAGADIISTNSFGANRLVQQTHGLSDRVGEMAFAAASIARREACAAGRKVLVAGSAGPTGRMWDTPFDDFVSAYTEQFDALVRGGVDLILLETCFSSINAKAAIYALQKMGCGLPLIISATVSDRSGRMLTGQTLEAFYHAVAHAPNLVAFGVNCALGARDMVPLVVETARFSGYPVIFYPNAGLPDEMGQYRDTPESMAAVAASLAEQGLLNITGGCCGTAPEHIAAIAEAVRGRAPRRVPSAHITDGPLVVSGLECVTIDRSHNFINVGERTNVAGSRKFARLIGAGDYAAALETASAQVAGGADIIDVNMDDPMLDRKVCMTQFLTLAAQDPSVARAALMIDSSDWETVTSALKCAVGKSIVNSISLKDGEAEFLRKALEIKALGAAMVVMAFDETGQAVTLDRKTEICRRSYRLLTGAGIAPHDIIFDANILAVGTGIAEHGAYGVDFIEAVRWIKSNLPGALTSGGVSNLSFAFRGNNPVREAMHSVFLHHAIKAGLDMAIVNPQMLRAYDSIDPGLRGAVEDVVLNSDEGAADRLVSYASSHQLKRDAAVAGVPGTVRHTGDFRLRLTDAIVGGGSDTLEADLLEACAEFGSAVSVVEGPLMDGMTKVGELFSEGRMFLPQVVKSASVMKKAVAFLQPCMEGPDEMTRRPKAVLATVRGDVHDIGKNIVATVLRCSGFEVIDLGVMVPCSEILDKAVGCGASMIGVSGLITPSLSRMEEICEQMASRGMTIPLFVGGAAASALHSAVRLAPIYPNVHYGSDASVTAVKARRYLSSPEEFLRAENDERENLCELYRRGRSSKGTAASAAQSDGFCTVIPGDVDVTLPFSELSGLMDWRMFRAVCGLKDADPAAESEAVGSLACVSARICARFFRARRKGDVIVTDGGGSFPMLRDGHSLADFYPEDGGSPLGVFAVTVSGSSDGGLVQHAARVTLAEAASSWLAGQIRAQLPEKMKLIMPGIGYPCLPDHSLKREALALLPSDLGITLTESASMMPEASICGLVVAHSEAAYRDIRSITQEAADAYAAERHFNDEEKKLFLNHLI